MHFLRSTQIIHESKLFSAHISKNSTTGCFAPCAETPNLDQYIPLPYVFHTWSFCAGRKTSTIGLFELFIIIMCWIFCAYTQILSRDVEDFCVYAQKVLIMISDNKVFQHWIICAYTQILNRDVEVFCVRAQKFLIAILDIQNHYYGYLRTYADYIHVSMYVHK